MYQKIMKSSDIILNDQTEDDQIDDVKKYYDGIIEKVKELFE